MTDSNTGHLVPSKEPCPKCGSTDIHRQYHAKDSEWDVKHLGDDVDKFSGRVPTNGWRRYAKREHIVHHCRTCEYDWKGLPLPKPKPAPKWKPCSICSNHEGCRGLAMVRNDPEYCGAER